MAEQTVAQQAERLSQKRSRILFVLAVVFLSQQASYFSGHDPARPVDHIKIGAWLVLSCVLLLILATGGAWLRSREVRELLNDETTREHRRTGFVSGFWAACLTAIGVYVVDMFEPLSARDAVHIILTVAIAVALLTFARLERRAHRDA